MIENVIKYRAAKALTTAKHCTGFFFPKIYLCDYDFAFFKSAINNVCKDDAQITVMTFEEAYHYLYKRKVPEYISLRINRTIDQS